MPGPVSQVPFIPDNAPFTAEQRAWLNGFLAGIYSHTEPTPAAEPPPALKIAVLYASQSGTAEGLARKLTKELTSKGHVATFLPLEGYTPASLAAERYALLIASTYGEGDPPDAVQPFYNQLCMEHFPRFENLSFSVLALGDSNYEHFCKFGRDLDEKLASLGAFRMCERVDCDVDPDEPFARWKSLLFKSIEEIVATRPAKRTAANDCDSSPRTAQPQANPGKRKRKRRRIRATTLSLPQSSTNGHSRMRYRASSRCIWPSLSRDRLSPMKQAMPVPSSRKTSPAWWKRFCTSSNSVGKC